MLNFKNMTKIQFEKRFGLIDSFPIWIRYTIKYEMYLLGLVIIYTNCISADLISHTVYMPSARFKALLSMIPLESTAHKNIDKSRQISNSFGVADIGGDHGIICANLAQILEPDVPIFYVDQAADAVINAKKLFKNFQLETRINVDRGSGLHPLLTKSRSVGTIITSGMGCYTISKILTHSSLDKIPRTCEMRELTLLGVSRLIIQPWPHTLYQMMSLSALLMNNGWFMAQQVATVDKDQYYITLGFDRVESINTYKKGMELVNEVVAFTSLPYLRWNPLTASPNQAHSQQNELHSWLAYLRKQQITLEKHAVCTSQTLLEPHWIDLRDAVNIEVARLSSSLDP